jgi:nucleoside recognition membrane protein YjiH
MLALGVVKIVEDLDGLKAAQNLLSPLLRPCLGIPGFCGLALIASLQSTDAGSAMTRALYDKGFINDKEALIFTGFQFSAGALLTNYLSSGAGLFVFLEVPIFIPLVIIFLFKFLAGNIIRLYAMRIKEV